jgi:hypothetical protein
MEASRTPKPAASTPPGGLDGAPLPPSSQPAANEAPTGRRVRHERRQGERRTHDAPVAVDRRGGQDRRQVERRAPRNINAYDLGADELELINAVNAHKARTGRAFPTWSEMLKIVRGLGYEKRR